MKETKSQATPEEQDKLLCEHSSFISSCSASTIPWSPPCHAKENEWWSWARPGLHNSSSLFWEQWLKSSLLKTHFYWKLQDYKPLSGCTLSLPSRLMDFGHWLPEVQRTVDEQHENLTFIQNQERPKMELVLIIYFFSRVLFLPSLSTVWVAIKNCFQVLYHRVPWMGWLDKVTLCWLPKQ